MITSNKLTSLSIAVIFLYLMSTTTDASYRPSRRQNFFDYDLNSDQLLRTVEQSFGTYGRRYGRPGSFNYDPNYDPFFHFMRTDSFWYFHSRNYRTIDFKALVRGRRDSYLSNDLKRRDGEERGEEENKKKMDRKDKRRKRCQRKCNQKKNNNKKRKNVSKSQERGSEVRKRLDKLRTSATSGQYELKRISYRTKPVQFEDFMKVLKHNELERNNELNY